MIRAAIIDDEPGSIVVLKDMLHEFCPNVELIATADTVAEGQKMLKREQPDLLFLDIALPDGYGFEVLPTDAPPDYGLIFTTAYSEFAIKGFEYAALHYLLKPIDLEALQEAVQRFEKRIESKRTIMQKQIDILKSSVKSQPQRLSLPTQEGLSFVEIDLVVRLEADGSYTQVFTSNGDRMLVSRTLSSFEELLRDQTFCRVHNKHLINLKRVKSYVKGRGGYVIMDDDSHVDVSVRKKEEFLRRIAEL